MFAIVTFLLFFPVLNLLLHLKFCVSSPNNWNFLPLHIRSSDAVLLLLIFKIRS